MVMLHERIRRAQQAALLARHIAAMPEYPIYVEAPGRYSIYIDGRRRVFDSERAARLAQVMARARWLAEHPDA
jgi:hypothetical protein